MRSQSTALRDFGEMIFWDLLREGLKMDSTMRALQSATIDTVCAPPSGSAQRALKRVRPAAQVGDIVHRHGQDPTGQLQRYRCVERPAQLARLPKPHTRAAAICSPRS